MANHPVKKITEIATAVAKGLGEVQIKWDSQMKLKFGPADQVKEQEKERSDSVAPEGKYFDKCLSILNP